jgi:NAD(P)-dependent dehydrogenase (short-subunit alcohol dehydrogenase family)
VFLRTDVTVWKQLEQMFLVAEKEFGEVDIVCPGAGVYEPVRSPSNCRTAPYLLVKSTGATSGVLQDLPQAAMPRTAIAMP